MDSLMNLYNKGSIPVDLILDLLNIDPITAKEKLEQDMFTLNDPTYNEMMRGLYSSAADKLLEGTDIVERIADRMGVPYEKPKDEGGGRF